MTANSDALRLLVADREDDNETATSVLSTCDKDSVIRALVDHLYGIDDAYFAATNCEGVLDRYLESVNATSQSTSTR